MLWEIVEGPVTFLQSLPLRNSGERAVKRTPYNNKGEGTRTPRTGRDLDYLDKVTLFWCFSLSVQELYSTNSEYRSRRQAMAQEEPCHLQTRI